jgi:hypothetical protein
MLAAGPIVGLLSGTLSYWLQYLIDPTVVTRPIGWYSSVVAFNVLAWTSWLLFVPLIWSLGARARIERRSWIRPTLFHAAASLVLSAIVCVIAAAEQYLMFRLTGVTGPAGAPFAFAAVVSRIFLFTFEWKVLLYWGVVGIQHASVLADEAREREIAQARLEGRLVEARLDALQRQLHPHFVFNTLNAVAALLHRDPDAAEAMLVGLGDLLRAVFRSHAQQEVPLVRELELTQQYLDIQRVRFGAGLRCEQDVPEPLSGALVPALLLQPLVENAIKHGFARRGEGTIRISARRAGDRLELTVADDGTGADAGAAGAEGVGLANTRARLEHLYPGRCSLATGAPAGGGFAVTLILPWQSPATADPAAALGVPA